MAMAMPSENPMGIRLFVTHVDGVGHFLKICGQLDQQAPLMIESLFDQARENLENGIGAVPPGGIHEGVICAAKYKDGTYYRAKVINTTSLSTGLVGVHFIDFGNRDIISLSTIRFLDKYDPMFLQLRGQATDYYLSRVIHPQGKWDDFVVQKLQGLLCYSDYPATIDSNTPIPLISMIFKGTDLSHHLATIRFGAAIQIAQQEALLLKETQQASRQPNPPNDTQLFQEHVPFLLNQNFPSNPASAMRLQQNAPLPFNNSVLPPSLISQRLLPNKVSRNTVNLKAPARQPQCAVLPHGNLPGSNSVGLLMKAPTSAKTLSPNKSSTYKSRLLEANSQHQVFVSYAEEGPELFAVQLAIDCARLQDLMDEINKRPYSSLSEPPMIGTVCLGRMSGDRIICRAIVTNLSGSQCKLFFVDFGDTEMVSYYDIFDIPEEFVKPNVFAMRFCLSGVKKLDKGPVLNENFKQLVSGQVLTLKVVSPEGPPLIQYGELYIDNKNVVDLLISNKQDAQSLQFKFLELLSVGSRQSVLVSYVDSCIKFFIQLSDNIDKLTTVMDAVKVHCTNSKSPGELPIGSACCARFPDDGNWYRARVQALKGDKIVVAYVDYGNEQEVNVSDLRTITAELVKFPAQALKCALKDFETKPVESKTSNLLEMLALEKTLMATIEGAIANDTMLVSLIDDTENPPLDIGRRMTQLSQPRSSHETKATTPVRKDAPEAFSSPEEALSEDGRKRSFKREKSFKEERGSRPPRDENTEFPQRGGSFRGRENNNSFDRAGPGRHSDKYGGRPERGDRNDRSERRGPKPWETNQTSPPQNASEDGWEEPAPQPSYQAPRREFNRDNNRDSYRDNNRDNRDYNRDNRDNNRDNRENNRDNRENNRDNFRDNRDRRKPRSEQDKPARPSWKKDAGGAGKRLRQAVEESSADTQNVPQRGSIQDRLKRDRFNPPEEKNDDWGNRNRENRPPRENRDNHGERREWGEKKEGWGQKRDFRDKGDRSERPERSERGDRPPRSNFTPRDRADKSYGSEHSFKSEGSGRAPPFKARSKFTQVQYKELPEPTALDTPFAEPSVEIGAQHEVSVSWIISPESFFTQILSLQTKFLEMMHQIPELYKGVKPLTGEIPVGATVLARYPADGVLYRATVVSAQQSAKFIVRYVDFGNKQLVDARDIWQLDRSLLELPKMAIHCSLMGVAPKDGEWKADAEIDLCFNAPRYQCIFQECGDEVFKVSLWNNGVSVADTLVEKELAKTSEYHASVTLKDEPIDMTIIVSQQIMCRVTHVESFNHFYVQLDIEKAALVEQTIANYDVAKLTPPCADIIIDGTHCTVKHEGKIYRAILSDTSDKANIKAVLPDYGNTITTSVENLMILPSDLSVYYYQSLHCSLNNYTEDSNKLMTLEELKTRLTGNKFIIYINDVDGITLVTTLYDGVTGHKVEIFEPDEGAYDEVLTLCMRSVFNYNFGMAYIAHAENLNEIYLQRAGDGDALAELLDQLYKFYEEGTPEPLTTFEVDGYCVAQSSDTNWYRANILSVEDTQVKVQFSDYGNTETIPKESLKVLDKQFNEPCALALVASLGLVALQENALSKLLEWVTEKEVQVTLSFGNDGWLSNLHLDGVDLSMKLINEKLATPQVAAVEEEKLPEEAAPTEEPISLPPGCTQVYISHIDTPGHFWLQMLDKVDKIDEIQAELQANAQSYPDIENREMGTPCIAKYLADEQWYRAEILDADADITTVRFVDYGNTDVLDNQPGLIKTMPEHLNAIERFGVRASVNAVPTGTGEWSEAATESFTQLVGDLANPVDSLIVLKDVTTYLDIFVGGQNITDKLVSEGHAARSEEAECGDLPSCFASHVNSPSEFWIQLESASNELQLMEEAMVDAENFPELQEKEEGVVCAAKYPEDGAWYRAQVIVDGSEGTEVLFMDYGNASITNELRNLPDELKVKPALSRKCALQKTRDIKTWSRRCQVKFNELAAEGATIFNVQFIASGDISIVELFLEGKSVTEELVDLCELQVSGIPERPAPVGQDSRCSGKICYVLSVDEFYVNLESTASDLEKVTEAMYNAAEFETIPELKVGTVCAAFWSEDGQWYRARLLEFCDAGFHVLFIDFGNKAKCEEFRQLPEQFAVMEPLAKSCRLVGVPDDAAFKENCRTKLDALALDDLTLKIEILDSSKEPMLVKVLVDDKDVLLSISSEKPAEEIENQETLAVPEFTEDLEKTEVDVPDIIEATEENKIDSEKFEQSEQVDGAEEMVKTENETDSVVKKELETESVFEAANDTTDAETVVETVISSDNQDNDEFVDAAEELNVSNELNDSIDSSHTVIENKSFETDLLDETESVEDKMEETLASPGKDISSETLENSSDTIKTGTPEKEESKESITDTGYTSEEKDSPLKDATESNFEEESFTNGSVEQVEDATEKSVETKDNNAEETVETKVDTAEKTGETKDNTAVKMVETKNDTVEETVETKDDTAEKTVESKVDTAEKKVETKKDTAEKTVETKVDIAKETVEIKEDTAKKTIETKNNTAEKTVETKDDTAEETVELKVDTAEKKVETNKNTTEKIVETNVETAEESVKTQEDSTGKTVERKDATENTVDEIKPTLDIPNSTEKDTAKSKEDLTSKKTKHEPAKVDLNKTI